MDVKLKSKDYNNIEYSSPKMSLSRMSSIYSHKSKEIFRNPKRLFIFALTLFCLSVLFSNSLALNFTIICMTREGGQSSVENKNSSSHASNGNDTKNNNHFSHHKAEFHYTSKQQGWLFSAVAVGSFIGAIPLPYLTSKFGTRVMFTIYGLISGLSMFFTPIAASIGYGLLFLMRVFQGISISALHPTSGSIVNEWAPVAESGLFIAFLSCHQQLGQIFTMPVAGLFCGSSTFDWRGIYYLLGFMTLIGFTLFFFIFRDTPKLHRKINTRELKEISLKKGCSFVDSNESISESHNSNPPYYAIFTDKAIIGLWIASIGDTGFELFSQYGPTYLNKVLDMDIQKTGFAAAFPFIGALMVKLISGPISDHLTIGTQKIRCIIFASISQFTLAFCLFLLGWMPIKTFLFAQIAYSVAVMSSSLNVVGLLKSAQLQSRQYVHVTMTVIAFINSGIVLLLPIFVSTLSPNNSPEEWPKIFFIIAGLVTITTMIFNFTCETDPRPWTKTIVDDQKSNHH